MKHENQITGLGFGLERLGILALRRPALFSVLLILLTMSSLMLISSVKFNGSVLSIIPKSSQNFQVYETFKTDFRDYEKDVAVIFKSPRLKTASGLSDLREISLELALEVNVDRTFSLFSFRKVDPTNGAFQPFFSSEIKDDRVATRQLDDLESIYSQASSFYSKDEGAAVVLMTLNKDLGDASNKLTRQAFVDLQAVIEELSPDDFEVHYSGLLPIGITIFDLLVQDQTKLTLVGLFIGVIVAVLLFKSWAAALLCFFPPLFTAIWSIGLFAVLQVPITYLTTILPALALVLAYADGIMLYHYWARLNGEEASDDKQVLRANLKRAILRVGPASALTSLTTAVALATFAFSPSDALIEFAKMGVLVVSFAFIAVIIGMPLIGLLFLKLGWIKSGKGSPSFISVKPFVNCVLSFNPMVVSIAALIAVGGLYYAQSYLKPEYKVLDYLPANSDARHAERITNEVFGGRSLIFVSVPVDDTGNRLSKANIQRLQEVTSVLEQRFQAENIYSLQAIWKDLDASASAKLIENMKAKKLEDKLEYFSKDGLKMLIAIRVSSDQSIFQTLNLSKDLRKRLNENLAFGADIMFTGFPVLIASEFSVMIKAMLYSLLLAIVCGVLLIGLATRSFFYALVSITPNLLPILLVEFIIYLQIGSINIVQIVALALGFGVAIDNAVHVINVFHQERLEGRSIQERMRITLKNVAPALFASTSIICLSTLCTLTSSLPIIPTLGFLVIAILIIALFANLIILPANILVLGKYFKKQ